LFQAEDGIRDFHVTGVQTCALPIWLFAEAGIDDFNGRITDQPGVAYYSIAGRSNLHYGGPDCAADPPGAPEFISKWAAESDAIEIGRASCRERVRSAVEAVHRKHKR